MGSSIDLCERRKIEILLDGNVPDKVTAWGYGCLAVHKSVSRPWFWTITHLPTGLGFRHWFDTADDAADALVEISTLRTDWVGITDADIPMLKDAVQEICARHGGERSTSRYSSVPLARLNGYSTEASSPSEPLNARTQGVEVGR